MSTIRIDSLGAGKFQPGDRVNVYGHGDHWILAVEHTVLTITDRNWVRFWWWLKNRNWWAIGTVVMVVAYLAFASWDAFGYPSNISLGYQRCTTCHVDPNGAGMLTPYGRSLSEEMATWAYEGEGQATWTQDPIPPSWLNAAMDFRYATVRRATPDVQLTKGFVMQAESEVAINLAPNVSLVASGGQYGGREEIEYRRHFAQVALGSHFTFRVGRFSPPFGINLADHTAGGRARYGFGQGLETYNVEARADTVWAEVAVSYVLGRDGVLELGKADGYQAVPGDENGTVVRATVFPGKTASAGLSGYYGVRDEHSRAVGGFFGSYGPTRWLHVLAEGLLGVERGRRSTSAFSRVGVEPIRGLILYTQADIGTEGENRDVGLAGGFRWMLRPHLEFEAKYGRTLYPEEQEEAVAIAHFWL